MNTHRRNSSGAGWPPGLRRLRSRCWVLGLVVAAFLVMCAGCRSGHQAAATGPGPGGPRWIFEMAASPDGAQLAVIVRDRDVDPITYSGHPSWIVILNVDDGQPLRQLEGRGTSYWCPPDWSPDGSHLLFITERLKPLATVLCELVSVDVASGATRRLYSRPRPGGLRALWLPGDAGVVFEGWPEAGTNADLYYLPVGRDAAPRCLTPSDYGAYLRSVAPGPLGTSWRAFYVALRDPFVEGEGFEHSYWEVGPDGAARQLSDWQLDSPGYRFSPSGDLWADGVRGPGDDASALRIGSVGEQSPTTTVSLPSPAPNINWAPGGDAVLCCGKYGVWVYRLKERELQPLYLSEAASRYWPLDKFSACWLGGSANCAVTCGGQVWVVHLADGSKRLLFDANAREAGAR